MIKPYSGKDPYIFVSYAHKDNEIILPIIEKMQSRYNVWFDKGIKFGREWDNEIVSKIKGASVFIFMITKNSLESQNCLDEIVFARDNSIFFLNIIVEDVELPDSFILRFGRYQMCHLFSYDELSEALDDLEERCEELENVKKVEHVVEKVEKTEKRIFVKDKDQVVEDNKKVINTVEGYTEFINLNETLKPFGASCVENVVGDTFTLYKIQMPAKMTVKELKKILKEYCIKNGKSYRFNFPLRGSPYFGLELANSNRSTVRFSDALAELNKVDAQQCSIVFGRDVEGKFIHENIRNTPHMLVCGTTGSGKSIFLHNIISTLISRNSPEELRLILVDTKRVEFNLYKDDAHLLYPIFNSAESAKELLEKLVDALNDRYDKFADSESCSIDEYNEEMRKNGGKILPYIFVIIDEYADLVFQSKEISTSVLSLAQKARAAGIHLIVSTQRPTPEVISGTLKANLPTVAAFAVASERDSKLMLGEEGAEYLLGRGDMILHMWSKDHRGDTRVQSPYISNEEIKGILSESKSKYKTYYENAYFHRDESDIDDEEEKKYREVKNYIMGVEYASISLIQRECWVGFNRASRYFKRLQDDGIVALKPSGNKGCKVLVRKV